MCTRCARSACCSGGLVIHVSGPSARDVGGGRHAASMRARTLLRDTHPEVFLEAVDVTGRPDHALNDLGTSSNLRVNWRCQQCGHLWVASPGARAVGRGCPLCAVAKRGASRARAPKGKALSDLFPEVSAEFVRNETRPESTPDQLRPGSHQRCQWRCTRCGHAWVASVASRIRGRGCRKCASAAQTDGRRRVAPGASAADKAPGLVAELVVNLTSPGVGLHERRPASMDRCFWRCADCDHGWEATITNRVTKGSGCPPCGRLKASATRRIPKPGNSLADTYPHLVSQLVANLSVPGRTASQMPAQAPDRCRWRCTRGHEWTTTVAARARPQGSGCPRCGGFGRSRFELEVAELLSVGCGVEVDVDVEVSIAGRRWRVDLYLPGIELYIDLDPAKWHCDSARDARKAVALAGLDYLRVRPVGLSGVDFQVCLVDGSDDGSSPLVWAEAIGRWLAARQLSWQALSATAVSQALTNAAQAWVVFNSGKPRTSAADAAPHLIGEFLGNLARPGIGLEWLPANAKDRARWACNFCSWTWVTSVASRAGAKTGCPMCAQKRVARQSSIARSGQALADLYSDLTDEFVACLPHPDRTPFDIRASSNFRCSWRCRACGHAWQTSPAARVRGSGCPVCGKERTRRSRTIAPEEKSLLFVSPALAREFVACLDEPTRTPGDLLPASNKKCQWRCSCGQEWSTTVASRTAGTGCPSCGYERAGQARAAAPVGASLADLFPELAAEAVENVDRPERDPRELKPGSHNRCRWCCAICNHSWVTSVKNRTRNGTRCPECVRAKRVAG